ncbi:DNA methyltransferase [bacterium]|nr:DNA methyltransferase [bacterium]
MIRTTFHLERKDENTPSNIDKQTIDRFSFDNIAPSVNQIQEHDRIIHDWYRFVLSFPPHLVRYYLKKFRITPDQVVLDPFCGTGTTLVECKKNGIKNVGIETHPMSHFATRVKLDWDIDPKQLIASSVDIAKKTEEDLIKQGIYDQPIPLLGEKTETQVALRSLGKEKSKLLITNSISPLPLHKTLHLLDNLKKHAGSRWYNHQLLALAKALVGSISNLHFGPEVGVRKIKKDAAVIESWLTEVRKMASDLDDGNMKNETETFLYRGDSREIETILNKHRIDAVITSPPYPNEKDYTRTTRLESVILGFIQNMAELRCLKKNFIRSNTRGVYKEDDDDQWILDYQPILNIADEIEKRRIELGKNSGFERQYARVTKLYFGGIKKHLAGLRNILNKGAYLAYVVGDQASYLRVMIRTGEHLAEIAHSLGYETVSIDLFRERIATGTKNFLREEVVVLRWNG